MKPPYSAPGPLDKNGDVLATSTRFLRHSAQECREDQVKVVNVPIFWEELCMNVVATYGGESSYLPVSF